MSKFLDVKNAITSHCCCFFYVHTNYLSICIMCVIPEECSSSSNSFLQIAERIWVKAALYVYTYINIFVVYSFCIKCIPYQKTFRFVVIFTVVPVICLFPHEQKQKTQQSRVCRAASEVCLNFRYWSIDGSN